MAEAAITKPSQGSLVEAALGLLHQQQQPCTLIDIGVNLADDAFDQDRDVVLARAQKAGVAALVVTGSSLQTSRAACSLAEASTSYPLYFTAGSLPNVMLCMQTWMTT